MTVPPCFETLAENSNRARVNWVAADRSSASGETKRGGACENDNEEDLFALPISPRSPEMERSPFSLL